jgi:hypothetical protein
MGIHAPLVIRVHPGRYGVLPVVRRRRVGGEAAAADPARPEARDASDLHGADLRRDAHQVAITFNADHRGDPARPEARSSAAAAAGVLGVDVDPSATEPVHRRAELAPDRRRPAADPAYLVTGDETVDLTPCCEGPPPGTFDFL